MWNLFSAVEPKVIKPARSLKQQLLILQARNLQQIQQKSKTILTSINFIIKSLSAPTESIGPQSNIQKEKSILESSKELENNIFALQNKLTSQNENFESCLKNRDQEKVIQQQFFKMTMKSYQDKKSQLNKYIKNLQEKVQKLQMLGFKTYSLSPDQDPVLNGFNQKYIEKYLSKISLINSVEQNICDFLLKNGRNPIKNHFSSLSKTNSQPFQKISLFGSVDFSDSLQALESQLQTILINQEITGSMINKRLRRKENQFQKLAAQQKAFKLALSKLQQQNIKLNNKQQAKKTQKQEKIKQSAQSQKELDVSFEHSIQQKVNQKQNQKNNSVKKQQNIQSDQQIPSVNFLHACENLITKTFLEEQENS